MKLSKKKENELYELIHNMIMDARIKLNRLTVGSPMGNEIDDIIFKLNVECPDIQGYAKDGKALICEVKRSGIN